MTVWQKNVPVKIVVPPPFRNRQKGHCTKRWFIKNVVYIQIVIFELNKSTDWIWYVNYSHVVCSLLLIQTMECKNSSNVHEKIFGLKCEVGNDTKMAELGIEYLHIIKKIPFMNYFFTYIL